MFVYQTYQLRSIGNKQRHASFHVFHYLVRGGSNMNIVDMYWIIECVSQIRARGKLANFIVSHRRKQCELLLNTEGFRHILESKRIRRIDSAHDNKAPTA